MRVLKKILKGIVIAVMTVIILAAVGDAAWIYVPQLTAQKSISDIGSYSRKTDDITVPAEAEIIALGEASHGNKEFQELKLSVLKQLVEDRGVRAFALEADFGEGVAINRFIHGQGDCSSAEQAVGGLSFSIYHTADMIELVQWMHDYNLTVDTDEQLSFYGFDLQNPRTGIRMLAGFCSENGVLPDMNVEGALLSYADGEYSIGSAEAAEAVATLESVKQELTSNAAAYEDKADYFLSLQICECALQCVECMKANPDNYIMYNNARDSYMAENVQWIREYEQSLGHEAIMISGHNGHVSYETQFYEPMGAHLRGACGKEYFVIGTDYYNTSCNINNAGADTSRANHSFCSADPLAAQAKKLGGAYYLNFSEVVDENGDTFKQVHSSCYMGSLGEGYSFMMHLMPMTNRIKTVPAEIYDAMIFAYQTTPISVIE